MLCDGRSGADITDMFKKKSRDPKKRKTPNRQKKENKKREREKKGRGGTGEAKEEGKKQVGVCIPRLAPDRSRYVLLIRPFFSLPSEASDYIANSQGLQKLACWILSFSKKTKKTRKKEKKLSKHIHAGTS